MSKVNPLIVVQCPRCAGYSHPQNFQSVPGPHDTDCPNCGYALKIWKSLEGDYHVTVGKQLYEPGFVLLKYPHNDLHFIVKNRLPVKDGLVDPTYVNSQRFYYEENSSPLNWLGDVVLVADHGNCEPDNLVEFIRWVSLTEIMDRYPDFDEYEIRQMIPDRTFVHEVFPELTYKRPHLLPERDLSAYVSDFELFKAIEFIRFGPEKTIVMNGVNSPSRRDPVLRTQAHLARQRKLNFADTIHHLTGTRLDIDTSHIVPLLWGERYWRKSDLPNHHLFKDLQDES